MLKIFLHVVRALVAINLLPFTLAAGCLFGLAVAALAIVGMWAPAGILAVAVGIVAALAPRSIPVLAIVGRIALIRRGSWRLTAV